MNTSRVSSVSANSTLLYIASALFAVALALLLWSAGQGKAESAPVTPTPDTVQTDQIHIQSGFRVPVRLRGLVESAQDARIGFDVAGELDAVLVEEGDTVLKGDVLAILDSDRLNAREKELQASLSRAKADAELTRLTWQRIDKLVRQELESGQRRDEAAAQMRAAQARVEEVAASLASLSVELAKTKLLAPFDGKITQRFVDSGTVVNPGVAVLGLTDIGQLQSRFAMPAADITLFEEGQQVELRVASKPLAGVVSKRLSLRTTQTRTIDMLVTLEQADNINPGDMVSLEVEHERTEQGAWLPLSALSNGLRGLWTVFVVEDKAGEATLVPRTVEVIYSDEIRAFVRGAIRDGETYVTGGTHKLSPGQHVALAGAPQ